MTLKVVGDAPLWGQGDTDARPNPVPRATSTRLAAIAVTAPAKIAGQEAADTADSGSRVPVAVAGITVSGYLAFMELARQCQINASSSITGIGTPSSHNKMPLPITWPLVQKSNRVSDSLGG